jgi:Fe-S cluster assembly iron-binding protein IscA
LALALDEPRDNDEVIEDDGYKFLVEKELLKQAQPISVDVTYMGFVVNSNLQLGGGGCGSSCGTGGSCAC